MSRKASSHVFFKNLQLFNSEISQIVRKLSPGSRFLDIQYMETNNDDDQPVLDLFCGFLSLPNGGMRNLQKKPQLTHNVFMTGRIQLNFSDKESIIYYGTEINYCKTPNPRVPNVFECITGFHYDALILKDNEISKDNNHPILHAQQNHLCGTRLFEKPEYSRFKGNYQCNFPHREITDEIRSIRIPTPQMDILSAVIMIIADYLVHSTDTEHKEFFKSFLSRIYTKLIPLTFATTKKVNKDFIVQKKLVSTWYPI